MAKFKINIFYVIASICSLLLVVYIWLIFLPLYEGTVAYEYVKNIAFVLTILLLASAGIQIFLSVKKTSKDEEIFA